LFRSQQAQECSEGSIDALSLRLLVAVSVGFVSALGVFRTIFGFPLHWFMIGGYITVVIVTWFAPKEIVGLAYDSGGVTTNIVTVPLRSEERRVGKERRSPWLPAE